MKTLTVEKMMKEAGITRWQAVKAMKASANAGVGTFVVGRRGWPSRLQS